MARFRDISVYANNSVIDINLVGEGHPGFAQTNGGALECHTDSTTCCRGIDNLDGQPGQGRGEWYYPDGSVVPTPLSLGSIGTAHFFYRTRDHMIVRLNHVDGDRAAILHGVYRCEIPGADGNNITRLVTLYDSEGDTLLPPLHAEICIDLPKIVRNGNIKYTLPSAERCFDLPQIANGNIRYTPPSALSSTLEPGRRFIGTIATYSCLPGYQLVGGSLVRVCVIGGIWNGIEPSCGKI